MTLIEVLFHYQDMLKSQGRSAANTMLREIGCYDSFSDIVGTFNDAGEFIDTDGYVMNVSRKEF